GRAAEPHPRNSVGRLQVRKAHLDLLALACSSTGIEVLGRARLDSGSGEQIPRAVLSAAEAKGGCPRRRRSAITLATARRSDPSRNSAVVDKKDPGGEPGQVSEAR